MATVFLNGEFVARGDARVSAFDAGLQHGVGLFETMLGVRGASGVRVLRLHEHLARLRESARALALSDALGVHALAEGVERTAARASEEIDVPRQRIRLTLTGGDLNVLERGEQRGAPHDPTLLIVASPATEYPRAMFERGVGVVVADLRVNPLDPASGHKTLNYWSRLRDLQVAATKRAGEALVFQVTNHLAGGCVSNALLVKDGVLLTPIARGEEGLAEGAAPESHPGSHAGPHGTYLPSPVLPGIVRRWALEWAERAGVEYRRQMLTIHDVLAADEVFLTNSSWGVLPVVRVEQEAIGDGVVGAITRRLVEAWEESCTV